MMVFTKFADGSSPWCLLFLLGLTLPPFLVGEEQVHELFDVMPLSAVALPLAHRPSSAIENFQGMVNKTLVLENRRGVIECMRRLVHQHQPGSSSRPSVATSSVGPMFHPAQPQFQPRPQAAGQEFSTPQRQGIQRSNNLQTPTVGNQSPQRTQVTEDPQQADRRCYNYGEKGHYTNRFPNSRTRANQPAIATPAPTRGANSDPVAAK
jgi:hypothetical protein